MGAPPEIKAIQRTPNSECGIWNESGLRTTESGLRSSKKPSRCLGSIWKFVSLLVPVRVPGQAGSVDPTFSPGDGSDLPVYTILPQANGQMFIGGAFTTFDNVERINVAHLNADGSRDDTFNPGTALDGPFPFVTTMALLQGG